MGLGWLFLPTLDLHAWITTQVSDEKTVFIAGAGLASMRLNLLLFGIILKHKLIEPSKLRELLDLTLLSCERLSSEESLGPYWLAAREHIETLIQVVETTPEMRGASRSRRFGLFSITAF